MSPPTGTATGASPSTESDDAISSEPYPSRLERSNTSGTRRTILAGAGGLFAGMAGCLGRVAGHFEEEDDAYILRTSDHSFGWPIGITATIVDGGYDELETPLTMAIEVQNQTDELLSYSWPNWQLHPDDRYEFFLTDASISGNLITFEEESWVMGDPARLFPVRSVGRSLGDTETNHRTVVLASNRRARPPPDEISFTVPISAAGEQYDWSFRLMK